MREWKGQVFSEVVWCFDQTVEDCWSCGEVRHACWCFEPCFNHMRPLGNQRYWGSVLLTPTKEIPWHPLTPSLETPEQRPRRFSTFYGLETHAAGNPQIQISRSHDWALISWKHIWGRHIIPRIEIFPCDDPNMILEVYSKFGGFASRPKPRMG